MRRLKFLLAGAVLTLVAACSEPIPEGFQATLASETPLPGEMRFAEVAARVEPVAEALCRERGRDTTSCNFKIVIDTRKGQPPNAFQTIDRSGRPIIGFTAALIANARNADELAFVIGHEASHHILGHIPQRAELAMSGALQAAILASAAGLDQANVEKAAQVAAEAGARRFSKEFELQADALGTEIALNAGFDAVRGSAFFDRLPDPGNRFLGTHPANAQRKAIVRATQKRLLAGG
ncbi:MAG: M48 family metallopeptidase [Paracoccaceae bacterium]